MATLIPENMLRLQAVAQGERDAMWWMAPNA